MATLQERIKERRTIENMTLLDLANRLGIKEATMQRYESGKIKNVKHHTIQQLAEILNCSPAYLMGWDDEVYPVNNNLLPDERKLLEFWRNTTIEGKHAAMVLLRAYQKEAEKEYIDE